MSLQGQGVRGFPQRVSFLSSFEILSRNKEIGGWTSSKWRSCIDKDIKKDCQAAE